MTRPKVLLVDDVELDLRRYLRGLTLVGTYDVSAANSVDEALQLAESGPFDAAVLDLKMPPGKLGDLATDYGEETGYAMAAKLVELHPDIHIIVLSHAGAEEQIEPAFRGRLNVRDMLAKADTKPIDLIRSLDQIFGKRSMTPTIFIVHVRRAERRGV